MEKGFSILCPRYSFKSFLPNTDLTDFSIFRQMYLINHPYLRTRVYGLRLLATNESVSFGWRRKKLENTIRNKA